MTGLLYNEYTGCRPMVQTVPLGTCDTDERNYLLNYRPEKRAQHQTRTQAMGFAVGVYENSYVGLKSRTDLGIDGCEDVIILSKLTVTVCLLFHFL